MFTELIPKYLKIKDSEMNPTILQDFVDGIEAEYSTIHLLIEGLGVLIDPDQSSYKQYLINLVGGDDFKYSSLVGWITKNITYLHKIKGTNQSWQKYWYWLLGEVGITVTELYKTERYETTDWSSEKNSTYAIKSSKIELCSIACETYDETLDSGWEEDYFDLIENVNPIHVRLKPNVNSSTYSDLVEDADDTLGCWKCETICEDSCESGVEIWSGSAIIGEFDDTVTNPIDDILIEVACISTCQISCEGCCETACECDACEIFCETGCETARTHGPDPEGGAGCGTDCEIECQGGCETVCTADCEIDCQFSCTDGCEDSCTIVCQYSCELSCESQYCETCSCQCNHTA